jgi:phosphomannomutase
MARGDVLLGGEESGAIGIPAHMSERDPFVVLALLTEYMAVSGKSLPELVAHEEEVLGRMLYARRDVAVDPVTIDVLNNVLPGVNPTNVAGRRPVAIDHADGLRVTLENDSWVLIRPSGNDMVMRVYAEAPTAEERDELLRYGCDIVGGDE